MFGLGFTEILVILVVALLVFGPEKLPEMARTAGRTIGDFRRVLDDMKREFSISAFSEFEHRERRLTTTMSPPPAADEPAPAAPADAAADTVPPSGQQKPEGPEEQ